MKIHLRDTLWLFFFVGIGLTWRREQLDHRESQAELKRRVSYAERDIKRLDAARKTASAEADVLLEEVRRLRGVIKSSLHDQREWFELEVDRNSIVAVSPATSEKNVLTLDTLRKIEDETGLVASRLRHFLTPIPELELNDQ